MAPATLVLALVAQIAHPSPTLPLSGERRDDTRVERVYGTPEPLDLWTLSAGRYHRHTVITKGRVRPLDVRLGYFEIAEENGRAVLFGVPEIARELARFTGKRVEVIGLARDLVASQGTCLFRARMVPQSVCDDAELPPTPDLTPERGSWPNVSITAWSIVDASASEARTVDDPATALGGGRGAKVRLRGRFGGADLERAMSAPAPEAEAWTLRTDAGSIWIVGKPARGSGWSLDRAYRGDLGRWLEVEGTVARCGTSVCVRARRVVLAAAAKTE